MQKKLFLFQVICLLFNSLNATVNYEFTIAIGPHAFYLPQGKFFVGATEVGAKEKSISAAFRNTREFQALAPEKIMINGLADQTNPLFNAAINKMVAMSYKALVTSKNEPNALYVLDDKLSKDPQLFEIKNLKDSEGNIAKEITAIASTAPILFEEPESLEETLGAFAALPNQSGNFNGSGSGISVLILEPSKIKIKENNVETEKTVFNFSAFNAQTGEKNGNLAFPIGLNTQELIINDNASEIRQITDMYYDTDLKCLYIAFDAQSGPNPTSGIRSVAVGMPINGKLTLLPIAADSAFDSNNQIVGGLGSSTNFIIKRITVLSTTTHLKYLVLVTELNGIDKVYALPLIDNFPVKGKTQDGQVVSIVTKDHGTLANVNSIPINIYNGGVPNRFTARVFNQAATKPTDLYSVNSLEALVGANTILPGLITDISSSKDAVIVSVKSEGSNQSAGVFISQAIFDSFGRINGWTNWQRMITSEKVSGFSFDPVTATLWSIVDNKRVDRSTWTADTDFEKFFAQEFLKEKGGIQGLQDYDYLNTAFNQNIGERLSLQILTGFNKAMLVQTGKDVNGIFSSNAKSDQQNQIYRSINGSLQNFNTGVSTLIFEGGALSTIGAITSSAIISNSTNWIALAGSGGLAILADNNGVGFNRLNTGFVGLNNNFLFKVIGDFKNIRKLISVHNELYILTSTALYKLIITEGLIAQNKAEPVLLAQANQGNFKNILSFSDFIISGPLALLATSSGLFRSGNGVDIHDAKDALGANWLQLILPETMPSGTNGPITRLFPVGKTLNLEDLILGGNIYVLNGYVGLRQSQIYRLFINVQNNKVSNDSVLLLPDLFIQNRFSFFSGLGDYRNYIFTDGSFMGASASAYGNAAPFLEILPPTLKSGQRFSNRNSARITQQTFHNVGQLIRNSATGALYLPGDFGLRINE